MAFYPGFTDDELRKKRQSLLSDLGANPQMTEMGDVSPAKPQTEASPIKPELQTYHPDSIGAFVQNGGVRESISGPFIKQDADGRFRNAGMNEMSSMFDPSFKGKTVDVWKGNQLSRYGYDENAGMAPLELSKQEQADNRTSRDNMLLREALNATPNESTRRSWDPKTGRLVGEETSYTSNVPNFLQQTGVMRNPEIVQDTSKYTSDNALTGTREGHATTLKQEEMQQTGENYRTQLKESGDNARTKLIHGNDTPKQGNVKGLLEGNDDYYTRTQKTLDDIIKGELTASTPEEKERIRRAKSARQNLDAYWRLDREAINLGRNPINAAKMEDYLRNGTDYNKKPTDTNKKRRPLTDFGS